MKRLTTESSLKPLVAQFVPIKIDVASEDYKIWRREHEPEQGAIPQMYIVRADGQELFNKVGGLPTEQLQAVLSQAIGQAGYILTDEELARVDEVLQESSRQLDDQNLTGAIETVSTIPALFDASIECYAKPIISLRDNVSRITEAAGREIKSLQDALKEDPDRDLDQSIELVTRIVELCQSLSQFGPLQEQSRALKRALSHHDTLQPIATDLRRLDALQKSRKPDRELLTELQQEYRSTSLEARIAQIAARAEMHSESNESGESTSADQGGGWTALTGVSSRTWTSRDGKFTVQAVALAVSADQVRLRTADDREIEVNLDDLSSQDRKWLKRHERNEP